ncbi:MAG TPA: hypothetical protein VGI66_17545 [Streptosporangiaceae bacterium]|jgi:hypothetical protein
MIRKILAIAGAAVASAGLALAAGTAAHASEVQPVTSVCPSWTLHSTVPFLQETGPGSGGVKFEAAAAGSEVVNASTVVLTKPVDNQTGAIGGTEFIAPALNIDLPATSNIIVSFSLAGGATTDAGAVRLFFYATSHPDTISTAPTGFTPATGTGGNILVTGVTGHIGAIGLVYDPSNDPGFKTGPSSPLGSVTFTSLRIVNHTGVTALWFTSDKCPAVTPSPTPSASSSSSPPAATGTTPVGGVATGGGQAGLGTVRKAAGIAGLIGLLITAAGAVSRRVRRVRRARQGN